MDTLSTSAMRVAQFLDGHDAVDYVLYPGIPTRRGHEIAARDMWLADGADDYGTEVNRYGHLLSFTVKAGAEAARTVLDGFDMIWRATDLGRIKSVATIPCISTHQQQGETGRELAGVPANLIRLSVGGEHPADIIADLDRALGTVASGIRRARVSGRA
jgi:cystathionine beta-lyase/cystathionine gamma-synthase